MNRTASLSCALLALVSCTPSRSFWQAARSATQREAGSVHIAVLAVAPWSRYAASLQPDFRLDAEQARREVLRDTSSSFEQSVRALGLGASVAQEGGDPQATSHENVRSGTYLDAPDVARSDAMLEYSAATALYQEVQLLNRSIRDAAIPSGYRPYLVRLQIALLPRRRNAPYDAYTTLSFFSPVLDSPHGTEGGAAADPLVSTLRSGPELGSLMLGNGPCVLPLVATDNLEGSLATRSQQDLRNISLAFLGFPGEFTTELAADLFQQELQAQVDGRDLNGLLTVGRIAENSLRVRIGAMQQASARHAMVPRNHHVSVLLMVPEDAPPVVDLVARTVLVDTETGEELSGTSPEGSRALIADVASRFALEEDDVRALLERVQTNDQAGFRALFARMHGSPATTALTHELWIDLVSLVVGSQFGASRFELPGHGEVDIPSEEFFAQTVVLVDDGVTSSMTIHGGTFGERARVAVQLHLEVEGRAVTLAPNDVQRSERALRLSFPSLASLGLAEWAHQGFTLAVGWSGDEVAFDGLYVAPRAGAAGEPTSPADPP